jgi:hypothetical protein
MHVYAKGDPDYLSPSDGGCWFCHGRPETPGLYFCWEFDTYVHLECLRDELQETPDNQEAQVMADELAGELEALAERTPAPEPVRHTFAVDTTRPAPGPWRMPTDCESRTRVYFKTPFRDCPTVCEVCPDLGEHSDATMRLIAVAHDLLDLANHMAAKMPGTGLASQARAIADYVKYG